ncbi:MAG: tRNA (N(6)-L-threonylcarbamoyladenosine(37)-C(2))-methylthiotransferase MtaB [Dehalococcoidia bacterium]|nr:tRNA (N(6)-L-threonylcarbamoyladenosine(37)-C(2))-methylthiotransferase MtaB [Dehalococcoidia bacterium]MDD5494782.1 tRNA (N(6)-L-threonylcarbamoyladenosine(37)-C(2))-methylthiotransferase MtaB [Dehalococcoidia bacterium]
MSSKPSITIQTLGCKLNQAESERIGRALAESGYTVTGGDKADIFVLNTCTVTHVADRKSRHMVRMLRKNNPRALIAVIGCYAERDAEALADCGADIVTGNEKKMELPQIIKEKLDLITLIPQKGTGIEQLDRVRSFIKIQDGCRNYCSYCIVPLVRSQVCCIPIEDVIAEVGSRVDDGYKEVVLTGTEIGAYQYEQVDLAHLIQLILKHTAIQRLHLSSLQPQQITADLIDLWQDRRLCRHFHIALQSGSEAVLKRMRRRYNVDEYRKAVQNIRKKVPDAAVTTDIMVGFPGESQAEFEESYLFCKEMEFAAIHVFAYSPRPGTLAASMPGRVSEKVKKERSLRMLDLAAVSAENFSARLIGRTRDVLWENEVKKGTGVYSGLTDNYVRAYARSHADISNTILRAKMTVPAMNADKSLMRASTKGNHGEIWSEIV